MKKLVKAAPAAAVLVVLGSASAVAAPFPVQIFSQGETYQLAAAEKNTSKVETTKAWLKTKKTQTSRWVGRQKQKIKRLVD